MTPDPDVGPAAELPKLPPGEGDVPRVARRLPFPGYGLYAGRHEAPDLAQQLATDRVQIVQVPPEDLPCQFPGHGQVGAVDLDVGPSALEFQNGLLHLPEERDGGDKIKQLGLVSAALEPVVAVGQRFSERVDDQDRFEQPLEIAVLPDDRLLPGAGAEPRKRPSFALEIKDAAGLRPALVHGGDEEPAAGLRVGIGTGGRDEDGGGAFNLVLHGGEPARAQVLGGGLDDQFARGDQGPERIGGAFSTGLFLKREDLVLEALASLVEKGPAAHARELPHPRADRA